MSVGEGGRSYLSDQSLEKLKQYSNNRPVGCGKRHLHEATGGWKQYNVVLLCTWVCGYTPPQFGYLHILTTFNVVDTEPQVGISAW